MKLEHFYSDWNGFQASHTYHPRPTIAQIKKAKALGGYLHTDQYSLYVEERTCVVVKTVGNTLTSNRYRDMYRILEGGD